MAEQIKVSLDIDNLSLLPSDHAGGGQTARRWLQKVLLGLLVCVVAGALLLLRLESGVNVVSPVGGHAHAAAVEHPLAVDAERVRLRPYKDTGVRVPVVPSYGSGEAGQLGFDHIYVVHRVGHPQNLARMVRLLQLLQISAEFVPVLAPPPTLTAAAPGLTAESVAEWHTRYRIYRDMEASGYKSALILDDSVDMELNIKTIMRAVHRHLPAAWDMVFPGHCGPFEHTQPAPAPALPALREARMPLCLHAHAVSRKGLLRLLNYIGPAPSSDIISMAIMRLKERGLLQVYSLASPVFVPHNASTPAATPRLAGSSGGLAISATRHLSLWRGAAPDAPSSTPH
ncbi:hypothetical protein IWQ57_000190 [Coemansia nantahalensis]|uniref:Uncharacterized protein n=1 Tax=Coemansia nantahalensis TaxID=2789366 RepID=A0ACC1K8J4_9FUNG|nr:hypothetical protein IWQ57_000190 [Coemansia nantahalensis]